jgi:hypothetical protein
MDMLAAIDERFPVETRLRVLGDLEQEIGLRKGESVRIARRDDGTLDVSYGRSLPYSEITQGLTIERAPGHWRVTYEDGTEDPVLAAFLQHVDRPGKPHTWGRKGSTQYSPQMPSVVRST